MKNKIRFFTIIFALILCFATFAGGGEWVKDGNNWKYKKNGVFMKAKWETIDNTDYYFDKDGVMAKGLTKIGAYYHMFDENGVPYATTGNFPINGKIYKIVGRGRIEGLEVEVTPAWYEDYKQNEARAGKKKVVSPATTALANLQTGTYANITADLVARVVGAAGASSTFMECFNGMNNEIRSQLREKLTEITKTARIPGNLANIPTYRANYQAAITDYKNLFNTVFNQLVITLNPKAETQGKAKEKFENAMSKAMEEFEDKMDRVQNANTSYDSDDSDE